MEGVVLCSGGIAMKKMLLLAVLVAGIAAPAAAQSVAYGQSTEVRGSLLYHDLGLNEEGRIEEGFDLQGEIIGPKLNALKWIAAPRASLMASVNTAGGTNYVAASLVWGGNWSERWFGEFGLGYALHDGDTTVVYKRDDPRYQRLDPNRLATGSADLFRLGLLVGYRVSDRMTVSLASEHLSHAGLLGKGNRQGLDGAGLRIGYTLGQ